MRDIIVLAIIFGSVPVCIVNPYFGVLMWYWVTYFNPHRFTWSYAYDFPVAMVVAAPTLLGAVFAKKSLRSLFCIESVLLMALWAWFAISYIHAQGVPLFAANMPDAAYEMNHISKIFLFTLIMIMLVNTRERARGVMLVTAGSLGLLAVKGAIFGLRTEGGARVWGPPDSFLSDNNAFGLALNMCLPLLFFLAREEKNRWMRIALRVTFAATVLGVLLTYSRGALLGLGVVLAAIILKTRHKVLALGLAAATAFFVFAAAPDAWTTRMGGFMQGNLDASAEQRLVSWGTSWRFSHDYPIAGGSFDVLPNVDVFQRYQPRPLPLGFLSSGPHSIYFQLLADQGFVGLGLFLLMIGACFWTLWRIRVTARKVPSAGYLQSYASMVEISILGFMVSGAFLGFVYLDVIYEMIGATVVLKMLLRREVVEYLAEEDVTPVAAQVPSETPDTVLA